MIDQIDLVTIRTKRQDFPETGEVAAQVQTQDTTGIDKLLSWLERYSYAEYQQEPTWDEARLGEELFTTTKAQLAEKWRALKTLAAEIQALEELLLL